MLQPQHFGRYLLTHKIATGGMAEIFLAKFLGAAGFEKDVVIKRILPHWSLDRDFISMLIDEAKIVVQLNHPNIVQVYELGREVETYYIAMEYLSGLDLRHLIFKKLESGQSSQPSLEVTLFIMTEILEGLSYAHHKKDPQGRSLQIVHRDISPQNILLSFDGAVKLTDFGIAKATLKDHETVTGVLKGKFAYMSPEQANQERLDHRSDLFAVGIILYELATGERLFSGRGDLDTLDRVRRAQVVFSPALEKLIPLPLQEIILKSLARDPERRYQNAAEFCEVLRRFATTALLKLSRGALAHFLNQRFSEEITEAQKTFVAHESQTRQFLTVTRTFETAAMETIATLESTKVLVQRPLRPPESIMPPLLTKERVGERSFRWAFPILVLILGGLLLKMFFRPVTSFKTIPMKAPAITQKVPPAVVRPQVAPADATVAVRTFSPEPATPVVPPNPQIQPIKPAKERAFISVQAIPWAYVSIDGHGKTETPAQKISVSEGPHRIEVFYEPENSRRTKMLTLKPNQHLLCIANFQKKDEKNISCSDSNF